MAKGKGEKPEARRRPLTVSAPVSRTQRTTARLKEALDDWREEFLLALREDGNVTAACDRANVGRTTAYKYRNEDDAFRVQWDESYRAFWDDLESHAHTRARSDDKNPALLIFLMKAHPSGIYRDKMQVGGDPDSPPVRVQADLSKLSVTELEALDAILGKATAEPGGG